MIIEDEILVALNIEAVLAEYGFECAGIAVDASSAGQIADQAEIALVDINLRDGATGGKIASTLADAGVSVVFVTANPREALLSGAKAVGVLSKPVDDEALIASINYALARRHGVMAPPPPGMLALT